MKQFQFYFNILLAEVKPYIDLVRNKKIKNNSYINFQKIWILFAYKIVQLLCILILFLHERSIYDLPAAKNIKKNYYERSILIYLLQKIFLKISKLLQQLSRKRYINISRFTWYFLAVAILLFLFNSEINDLKGILLGNHKICFCVFFTRQS